MVFAAIGQACQSYWDNIPSNTGQTIGKSALFSFTITLILKNPSANFASVDLAAPLKAAALAATASLVHSLITPIFNYVFGDDEIYWHRELLKRFVVIAIVIPSAQYAATSKVDLVVQDFLKLYPISLLQSILRFAADATNYLDPDPHAYAVHINYLRQWGLYAEPGTNSTYIYA